MISKIAILVRRKDWLVDIKNIQPDISFKLDFLTVRNISDSQIIHGLYDIFLWEWDDSDQVQQQIIRICQENPYLNLVILTNDPLTTDQLIPFKQNLLSSQNEPITPTELNLIIENAINSQKLKSYRFFQMSDERHQFEEKIVGESTTIKRLQQFIELVSKSHFTPCLLRGGIGTGRHLTARKIHQNSSDQTAPFIEINCQEWQAEEIGAE